MKRTLPLVAAGLLAGGQALAAGPAVIGSIYVPDVEGSNGAGTFEASPDALDIEIRQPLNRNFWIGARLAMAFGDDQVSPATTPATSAEIGNSLMVNLGVANEFAHHVEGYAYIGYGKAAVDVSGAGNSIDGNGIAWGLGIDFLVNDHLLVDAGYATLFDGDMEDNTGTQTSTTIAGPRVGLGFRF